MQQNQKSFIIYIIYILIITNIKCFNAFPQCNLGFKLFSVERGSALCASFVPFECVGLCEWIDIDKGGCNLSSHYSAFRGQRTYMSGFILNDQSFLVQCCATLATNINLGKENEPICRWSEQINTVIDKPTLRLNFPLEENEYFRDLKGIRLKNGAAKIQAEICQFSLQRTNCDRRKMSQEENHQYSLLLLRLQRAKDFFQNRMGIKILNSGSSFNNKNEEEEEEIIQWTNKNFTEENKKEDLNKLNLLKDEHNNINLNKNRFIVDGTVAGLNKLEKQNNISLFNSKPKLLLNNENKNNNILLRKLNRLHNLNNRKTISTPKLVPFPVKKRQQNGQRIVNIKMIKNKGIRRKINIPLKNNYTKEIIPSKNNLLNWADIDEFFNDFNDNSNKQKINLINEEINWPKKGFNRRELGIKKLKKDGEINIRNKLEELEELNKEKIKEDLITSIGGGGSFAIETIDDNIKIKQQKNKVNLIQIPLENIENSPNIIPLINPLIKKVSNRKEGWVHINGNKENNNNIIIIDKLNGLIECCQQQSFGCKPLCTRNVSKEQIKQAMSTGLCPPLSLTNVIQCFPRFYNITSVGQCCSSSIELNNNNIVPSNISQRKIPSQCLSLCSSNFHLTLSHLVCIEYVEHILGCYRQLLIKENELIKNNELKESSLINIQNFQH